MRLPFQHSAKSRTLRPAAADKPTRWFLCILPLMAMGCNPQHASTLPSEASPTELASPAESKEAHAQPTLADAEPPAAADKSPEKESCPELDAIGARLSFDSQGQITAVDMGDQQLDDRLAQALPRLRALDTLAIHNSNLSESGWKLLGGLSKLKQLDLRGCQVDDSQLRLALSGMPELVSLRLNGQGGETQVTDQGLEPLRDCPKLKLLALDYLPIGLAGLQNLSGLKQLAEIYLAGSKLDDRCLHLLAEFRTLRKLRAAQTSITDTGVSALADLPLEELDLSECNQLTDEVAKQLCQLKSLKKLNLFKTAISDTGVAQLEQLSELRWLNLDQTGITDAALPHVGRLKKLEFLHLGSTAITDQGMPDLVSLKSLKNLIVTRTAVTQDGVNILKNWLSRTDIQLEYVPGK